MLSLNDLFHHECRNYEYFLEKYCILSRQYDELEHSKEELEAKLEASKEIQKIAESLKSEAFKSEKENLILPENFKDFEKAFSDYQIDEEISKKLQYLEDSQRQLELYLNLFRDKVEKSLNELFYYIKQTTSLNEKLCFSTENNSTAIRVFILFYADPYHFKYNRDAIELKECKLDKEFMKHYLADDKEAKKDASEWFLNQAKQYTI